MSIAMAMAWSTRHASSAASQHMCLHSTELPLQILWGRHILSRLRRASPSHSVPCKAKVKLPWVAPRMLLSRAPRFWSREVLPVVFEIGTSRTVHTPVFDGGASDSGGKEQMGCVEESREHLPCVIWVMVRFGRLFGQHPTCSASIILFFFLKQTVVTFLNSVVMLQF
ncbi:hypothetical protein M758_9G039500 [Ceratodon purpureus]|nr:hypothetical protein M758_9G039500 [Ceratodon purpureus]